MNLLPDTRLLRRNSGRNRSRYFPSYSPCFPRRLPTSHYILCEKWNELGYHHFHAGRFLSSLRFQFPNPDFEAAYYSGGRDAFCELEDEYEERNGYS